MYYATFTGVCRTTCTNPGSTSEPCVEGETCKQVKSLEGEEGKDVIVCIPEGTVGKGEPCNTGTKLCKEELFCAPKCLDQNNEECMQMVCQTRCPTGNECTPPEKCVDLTISGEKEKVCIPQ